MEGRGEANPDSEVNLPAASPFPSKETEELTRLYSVGLLHQVARVSAEFCTAEWLLWTSYTSVQSAGQREPLMLSSDLNLSEKRRILKTKH